MGLDRSFEWIAIFLSLKGAVEAGLRPVDHREETIVKLGIRPVPRPNPAIDCPSLARLRP